MLLTEEQIRQAEIAERSRALREREAADRKKASALIVASVAAVLLAVGGIIAFFSGR